ncbi:beta-propeller domain-containing protein [Nitrospira defluvii]|nr:beta-propeller domain-containing protein [Nitrospira defluvii]
MKQFMKQYGFLLSYFILLGFLYTSCSSNNSAGNASLDNQLPETPPLGKLSSFEREAELEAYLKKEFAESALPIAAYEAFSLPEVSINTDLSNIEGAASVVADNFSETNVQEREVDESDKVKTDGTYFYIAQRQSVKITKIVPADAMESVAEIKVEGQVDALYLHKNHLIILYTPKGGEGITWANDDRMMIATDALIGLPIVPVQSKSGVFIVDVSDPTTPKHLKEMHFEGVLVSSRLLKDKLHLVMRFFPILPQIQLTHNGSKADYDAAVEKNKALLNEIGLEDLLPKYEALDVEGNVIESGELLSLEEFARPFEPGGGSIVSIITFDLGNPVLPYWGLGLVADIHSIYASQESLFLTATRWNSDILPVDIAEPEHDLRQKTIIHQFDLTTPRVIPIASGSVWGRILNRYSLSEYKEILRIATITGFGVGPNATARQHVFTLETNNDQLKVIGKLENIAPGERLTAARFIGERGFLVTVVQIDPLFTIDLSDPRAPTIAGELSVPGFSTYIHAFGETHLITMGRNGRQVQLSMFDVGDFENPTLAHTTRIGNSSEWSYSEALYQSKAFTFWAAQNLLAIPATNGNERERRSALYVYHLTKEDGFKFLGQIKTSDFFAWTRGIFVDKNIYAVQENGIYSAEVDDIENTVQITDLRSLGMD